MDAAAVREGMGDPPEGTSSTIEFTVNDAGSTQKISITVLVFGANRFFKISRIRFGFELEMSNFRVPGPQGALEVPLECSQTHFFGSDI